MQKEAEIQSVIEGCKAGDSASFRQLLDLYSKRCYGYFYRLSGSRDASDELLSELFMKLVEKIGSYSGGQFEAWLFTVARNVWIDHLRQEKRRKETHVEALDVEAAGEDEGLERLERIELVQSKLMELDKETMELIVGRYYSGMSFKELAQSRKEPIGTTLSKVHRGLKKLRELMG